MSSLNPVLSQAKGIIENSVSFSLDLMQKKSILCAHKHKKKADSNMVLLPTITATFTKGEFAMNEKRNTTTSDQLQHSFDFKAMHNGVQCIASMNPDDVGTERQFWFTRQMLREIFDVKSDNTITNHVESLVNRGVIEVVKNLTTSEIPTNSGIQKSTLYDLKVFNYLVMRLDTDRAWDMKAKFNDVLVKHETNQNQIALPQTYIEALEALLESKKAEERTRLALVAEQEHVKEIQAGFEIVESRIQKEVFKQSAKAFSDLGVERKKTKRLEAENTSLKTENEELKANLTEKTDQADFLKKKNEEQDQYIPTRYKIRYWVENFGHEPSPFELAKYSRACDKEPIRKPLPSKIHGSIDVNFYHVRAWRLYEQFEWAHVSIKRPSLPLR